MTESTVVKASATIGRDSPKEAVAEKVVGVDTGASLQEPRSVRFRRQDRRHKPPDNSSKVMANKLPLAGQS